MRGDDEVLVVVFPEGEFDVLEGEGIPAIPAHELDGCFYYEACLKFDEGLKARVVLFVDFIFDSLRVDNMMYEIGVGK